jgi:hypothetical protein
VRVPRSPIRTAVTIVLSALALAVIAGCGVNDSPKSPGKSAGNSAKARCAGVECRVRIVCKGRVHVVVGPAPVNVRTSKTALVTTFFADFAGSRNDATVRC